MMTPEESMRPWREFERARIREEEARVTELKAAAPSQARAAAMAKQIQSGNGPTEFESPQDERLVRNLDL